MSFDVVANDTADNRATHGTAGAVIIITGTPAHSADTGAGTGLDSADIPEQPNKRNSIVSAAKCVLLIFVSCSFLTSVLHFQKISACRDCSSVVGADDAINNLDTIAGRHAAAFSSWITRLDPSSKHIVHRSFWLISPISRSGYCAAHCPHDCCEILLRADHPQLRHRLHPVLLTFGGDLRHFLLSGRISLSQSVSGVLGPFLFLAAG